MIVKLFYKNGASVDYDKEIPVANQIKNIEIISIWANKEQVEDVFKFLEILNNVDCLFLEWPFSIKLWCDDKNAAEQLNKIARKIEYETQLSWLLGHTIAQYQSIDNQLNNINTRLASIEV